MRWKRKNISKFENLKDMQMYCLDFELTEDYGK